MSSSKTRARALENARGRIDHWRRGHRGRKRIPELLWAEATELAREHGVYHVSRAMRLNSGRLKARLDAAEAKAAAPAVGKAAFVELDAALVAPPSALTIELFDEGGRLVRIQGASRDDAVHIAQALCAPVGAQR